MSEDPTMRQLEKRIANEAHVDKKHLNHAIKDLTSAEKTHNKSIKVADKAQHNLDKAVKKEHKAATALNKAFHKHEAALADQRTAEKNIALKQQHEERLAQDLQKRRATVEEWQHRKEANDQQRELKLSQIHAQAASRSESLGLGFLDQHGIADPEGARTEFASNEDPDAPEHSTAPGMGPAGAHA